MKKIKELIINLLDKFEFLYYIPHILFIILVVLLGLSLDETIKDIIFIILAIISILFLIIYIISSSLKNKKRQKQIILEDKNIIEKYLNKEYEELITNKNKTGILNEEDYWYLYDEIEHFNNLCTNFIKGEKKLYEEKKEVINKDFENFIISLKNEEIENIYKELKDIKKIIFKYYDKNGNWKTK